MSSCLYWITGLSGAGKTTIGQLFYSRLKISNKNVVFLDGDILREVLNITEQYSPKERRKIAMTYSRLCKLLTDQDIEVVIATISMFHEVRDWNRSNIEFYREVYIKVPNEVLIERDQKKLYSRALKGEIQYVIGADLNKNIEFEEPKKPDIIINNDGLKKPEDIVDQLIKDLKLKI
ncbi:adenylyl-sulfate kinase [Candidatus Pseudothioglobus singularis]|nr:adenylyl-sulfate kinase [Candidatus Pseudothioglobus singularis]